MMPLFISHPSCRLILKVLAISGSEFRLTGRATRILHNHSRMSCSCRMHTVHAPVSQRVPFYPRPTERSNTTSDPRSHARSDRDLKGKKSRNASFSEDDDTANASIKDDKDYAEALRMIKQLGLDEEVLKNLLAARPRAPGADEGPRPTINVFHKDEHGNMVKEQNIHDKDLSAEELEKRITELEQRLREAEDSLENVHPDTRDEIEEMLELADKWTDDSFSNTKQTSKLSMADSLKIRAPTSVSNSFHIVLSALNKSLVESAQMLGQGDLTLPMVNRVWKNYLDARNNLALQWSVVPRRTWDLLWDLTTNFIPHNQRASKICILSKDMAAANISLAPQQQLLAIGALFADGWPEDAVRNWKRCVSSIGSQPETLVAYWSLGVQMHSLMGDIGRAKRNIDKVLKSGLSFDPQFLLPFIHACTKQVEYVDTAWEAYRQMRKSMGPDMNIELYDEVIHYFLSQNLVEFALRVFVDMMLGTWNDARCKQLPRKIGNKFFFGKWLKRLIGAGDLDGAETVLKFMLSNNIRPATIQINGLIGAWLRSGVAVQYQKAEDMAWDLINARLAFVKERSSVPVRRDKSVVDDCQKGLLPESQTPMATSETFALLAQFYQSHAFLSKLEYLWRVVKEAEIEIDGYLLSLMLETYRRAGRESEAFEQIFSLSNQARLQLTWASFRPLWLLLWSHDTSNMPHCEIQQECQLARKLFAEMVKSAEALRADIPITPKSLARIILATFTRLGDNQAARVALHALVERFGLVVTDDIVINTVMGKWVDNSVARRAVLTSRLRQVTQDMANFLSQRLRETGRTSSSLDRETRSRELILYLDRVLAKRISIQAAKGGCYSDEYSVVNWLSTS